MKISYNNIMAIDEAMALITDAKGRVGYAVYKNRKNLSPFISDVYHTRDLIIQELGEQDPENEGRYYIRRDDKENIDKLTEKLKEKLEESVDVDLYQIDRADWDEFYDENLSAENYNLLEIVLVKADIPENAQDKGEVE